jgi:CRISPR-associated protein Csb2
MARMKDGREETTLVFDTFADVGDGTLWVRWPATLDEDAQGLFDALVAQLGYLGRSESWVVGESVSDAVTLPNFGHAFPHSENVQRRRELEQIVLTAPETADNYANWRRSQVDPALLSVLQGADKKATAAQKRKAEAIQNAYPLDLVDCLQLDTAWWRTRRWSRAPGARSVVYWREGNALQVGPPSAPKASEPPRVEMMLLALTTPSGSKSALPALARTLPQADLIHRALVSKLGFHGDPCPEIVGRDAAGEPLRGHRHSHLLPVDLDGDGRIDHIILFARMGLGGRAQHAVRNLRRTYTKRGVGELQLAVAGAGALDDLRRVEGRLALAVEDLLGPAGVGATEWITDTPFVPPRFLKRSGSSSLVGQVEAELTARGLPAAKVEVLDWTDQRSSLRHFIRRRMRGPQPPQDTGFAVRLLFDAPVLGPICLGYGSHFGLGRFRAAREWAEP